MEVHCDRVFVFRAEADVTVSDFLPFLLLIFSDARI